MLLLIAIGIVNFVILFISLAFQFNSQMNNVFDYKFLHQISLFIFSSLVVGIDLIIIIKSMVIGGDFWRLPWLKELYSTAEYKYHIVLCQGNTYSKSDELWIAYNVKFT